MPKKEKAKTDTAMRKNTDKIKDAVDETMKGPNGEKVYTGPKGGKYYMKGTQKVYLPTTTKKKPA